MFRSKLFWPLWPLIFIFGLAAAPAQTVTVTAAHLGGSSPITGVITFQPVINGQQASARLGSGGGQQTRQARSAAVTAGAFSITLADTSQTAPLNLCYAVTAKDNNGLQVLGPGYTCVQPASSNSWCSGGSCNFDSYSPSVPALPVETPASIVWSGAAPNSLGVSLSNFSDAHVSQLSQLTTSNSLLAVGSVVIVSDAASAGDTSAGGGNVREFLQCAAITGTTCSNWVSLAGGSTGSGGGSVSSALLGLWFLNEGSAPSVDQSTGDLSPMSTITATWAGASSPLTGGLTFAGNSNSYAVGNSNAKLQMDYTQAFSYWGWLNLVTPTSSADVNPRFLNNVNASGAAKGWSFGANYNATFITGCTSTSYCPLVELLGAGGYPNNSYDAFCQQGITTGGRHLVVITYDGQHNSNSTKCFIDNVQYAATTISTSVNSSIVSTDFVAMGNEANKADSNTHGTLGPQGIIARVLTTADAATLWGNPYATLQ